MVKSTLNSGRGLFIIGLLFLMSCSSEIKPANYESQRSFFLNTIEQVQHVGRLLQQKKLTDSAIEKAMIKLDSAMMEANSVENSFLKWIDPSLYQAFNAYLVKGIENYRLGFVYENSAQQAKGIEQLQKWWAFWQLKRPSVLETLNATL